MTRLTLALVTAALAACDGYTTVELGPAPLTEQCFVVADGDVDSLFLVNKDHPDTRTRQVRIGAFGDGVNEIEAIAVDPVTLALYAANANRLGVLDTADASFDAADKPFGTTAHPREVKLRDIDGLSFDPRDGRLYGTVRRGGDAFDLLIEIDKHTGAHVPNAFGDGLDFLEIPVEVDGVKLDDIDDLAIDLDGTMYAVANKDSGARMHLVVIDADTVTVKGDAASAGVVSARALFRRVAGGTEPVVDVEGLGFDAQGRLWGTGGVEKLLYQIVPETGEVVSSVAIPQGADYEAIDCLIDEDPDRDDIPTLGEVIIGTDPLDPDTDGDCILDGHEPDFALDIDGDGLINALDRDSDGDGTTDDVAAGILDCGLEISVQGGGCSATDDNDSGWLLLLVAVFVLGMALRGGRRLLPGVVAVALVASAAGAADAQVSEQFTLERFRLSGDRQGVLDLEWGATLGHLGWDLGLWMGTADDPLVVVMRDGDDTRIGELVEQRLGGQLVATVGLMSWLQAGIELPVILSQSQDAGALPFGMGGAITGTGLGDLRLVPKLQFLRAGRHLVDASLIPAVTVPTSTSADYFGERGVSVAPEVAISRAFGPLRLATNLGYRARPRTQLFDLVVDDEVFWRVGAGYRLGEAGGPPVELDVTVTAATKAADFMADTNNNHVEALAAAQVQLSEQLLAFAGVGAGINEGFGTPDWRLFAGVRFGGGRPRSTLRHEPAGGFPAIATDDDEGRGTPVTPAGTGDEPLCVGDTIEIGGEIHFGNDSDALDEASRRWIERDVAARMVAHPGARVTVEGHTSDTGSRAHNIDLSKRRADAVRAYLVALGIDGERLEAAGYGPDRPIADNATAEGRAHNRRIELVVTQSGDDCPTPPPPPCEKLDIGKVHFQVDAAAIVRQSSYDELAKVLAAMAERPDMRIRIEGHTSSEGSYGRNKVLSHERAIAVMAYLVERGVAADRMEAVGFGPDRLAISPELNADDRRDNRRVEFTVLDAGTCAAD